MTKLGPDISDPLAIYLHWPYCARICPYCDFNVHRLRREGEADRLVAAMVADLSHWRSWTGPRQVGSIHFGGGTPSLLKPTHLRRLLRGMGRLWDVEGAEVALEANPNDVTPTALSQWKKSGLTRLSLGVQSFDDRVLSILGRDHEGADSLQAVQLAMEAGFSVSADLIFGVAGEPESRLERDLNHLLDMEVPHISTYQLTVEPGTAFANAEARGIRVAVGEDRSASDFDHIRRRLTGQGYQHYEVSNFARPGQESRHNLAYWRGQDYVGVGPGAHGRLWTDAGRVATETVLRPADYIEAVERTGSGLSLKETLARDAAAEEYVMMGLRITEGLSLSRLARLQDEPFSIDPDLLDAGFLARDGDQLRATEKGRPVLDALTRALLT